MDLDTALGLIRNRWDKALEEHTAMEALLQAGEAAQKAEAASKAMVIERQKIEADLAAVKAFSASELSRLSSELADASANVQERRDQAAQVRAAQAEEYRQVEAEHSNRVARLSDQCRELQAQKANLLTEIKDLQDQKAKLEEFARSMLKS